MAFSSTRGGVPPTPTLPTGVQIASFDTYLEAQRAVDLLSDKEFAVQHTTIVGTDLRMVERITGRLSYPRVALAGAMSGAWFGLFVGLLFGLLSEGSTLVMLLPALVIGAAFGILFALVSYAFTGGKRDFTSSSQVVASRYALLCEQSRVGEAVRLLGEAGIRTRVGGDPAWQQPAPSAVAPSAPYGAQQAPQQPGPAGAPAPEPRPFTPLEDEHGNPRYGQRRPAAPQDGEERTS
ncbi:general stress protein [Georgenia phoenicis]|uniref:general stress protein n=1 Tax=Georgenia sp. 1P07AB TaxID=554105 RepID=UPI0039AFFF1F